MFLKSTVKVTRFFFVSAVLLLAISNTGLSQVISDEAIDTIDEIVVYGAPTLRLLRDEVYEAEVNFYELFNALNNGRQFDVKCFYRSPVGSHIKRRVCEAQFVTSPLDGVPRWAYFRHKAKQMNQEIVTLVDNNPDLHAAYFKFVDAKQNFESTFRDRCGNRLSICRK